MKVKPWCNYSIHRTSSVRRACGGKRFKAEHGSSKGKAARLISAWWWQRSQDGRS